MPLQTEKERKDHKTPLGLLLAVILAFILISAPAQAANNQSQTQEKSGQSVEELKKTAPGSTSTAATATSITSRQKFLL